MMALVGLLMMVLGVTAQVMLRRAKKNMVREHRQWPVEAKPAAHTVQPIAEPPVFYQQAPPKEKFLN